jgi:hypothetical protein
MLVAAPWRDVVDRIRHLSEWSVREGTPSVKQTHISVVLIGRDHVLKLKKPVDFGFLDYTSLEKRRRACEDEVRLNRRLCPDIYLGVVAVTGDGGEVHLEARPASNAVVQDWGVWMNRLPDAGMLDRLVADGNVTESAIRAIAAKLVSFHDGARRGPDVEKWGLPSAVSWNWRENFEQTATFLGRTLDRVVRDSIRVWVEGWIATNDALLLERVRDGRIVDGHGDVRSESICVSNGLYIFDCVEFNDRFRCGDVASEAAFLAADLDSRNRPDLGYYFTRQYELLSGDEDLWRLLPFYRCYRAFVRGKVSSFVSADSGFTEAGREWAVERASRHFDLAKRYASPLDRPAMVAVGGLSGTGKTSLARAVAGELGLCVISSDTVRRELFPQEKQPAAFGHGTYSRDHTAKTYEEMIRRARLCVRAGQGVVLDATFLNPDHCRMAMAAAAETNAPWRFVACRLDPETVRDRMAKRSARGAGDSDASIEIHLRQRDLAAAGIAGLCGDRAFVADTSGELWRTAHRVADWLRRG